MSKKLIRPDAQVCLVGPSVPLSDVLFSYGIHHLSGFCAGGEAAAVDALRRGVKQGIFRSGYMVLYSAKDTSTTLC